MNDKDKEAFEKWWKENMPNPDWLSSDHASDVCKAWQAACEYKQKEIDELTGQLKSCVFVYEEKVTRLLAENAKLRECVEFYADLNNWSSNNNFNDEINDEDCELFKTNEKIINIYFGGKLARKLLKELVNP